MRRNLAVLFVCLLNTTLSFAADSRPTEDSIRRLLTVTEAKKLLDGAASSIDQSVDMMMKQALKGQTVDEQTQKIIDDMRTKMSAVLKESLRWEDLEPMFIDIYSRSLTQGEVNGMLKFYESEAGQAVVRKLPLITQNTMQAMQARMQTMIPKIVQIQQDTLAKLKAAKDAPKAN
jgi:uncharacterized protein